MTVVLNDRQSVLLVVENESWKCRRWSAVAGIEKKSKVGVFRFAPATVLRIVDFDWLPA